MKLKNYFLCSFSHLNLIYMIFTLLFSGNNLRNIYNHQSEIKLSVKGNGNEIYFLNNNFYENISEVIINDTKIELTKTAYNFENGLNNVTIRFHSEINSCEKMFNESSNIIEIDLSNFDTSKVTNMDSMFFMLTNLEKINFGNINTSLVENMHYLFHHCYKLSSIDLSNFDTSSVTTINSIFRYCIVLTSINVSKFNTQNMVDMLDIFAYCHNLTSVDLSNFDTSKVTDMQGIFYQCFKLRQLDLRNFNTSSADNLIGMFHDMRQSIVYINIYSFIIKDGAKIDNIFNSISPTVKICINDEKSREKLKAIYNSLNFDCSDVCFNENIKIDLKNNQCIESCKGREYKYEYNNYCYENCPYTTYTHLKNNNEYFCSDIIFENYYYYSNTQIYKECFNTCKACDQGGNEIINNCIECKSGFIFSYESIYIPEFIPINLENNSNCYKQCEFYYYFNEENIYQCTHDKNCPEKYTKLIKDKNICIDDCKKDNIYKYEYNNSCIDKCPYGTLINEINGLCIDNYNGSDDFVSYLQNMLINNLNTTDLDNGLDYIYTYKDGKIIYTITTPSNQVNNKDHNSTKIFLNECEDRIKNGYNISENNSLYILKIDNYLIDGRNTPNVEYEIYYPLSDNKLEKANLTLCSDLKIEISIPANLSLNEIDKYNASSGLYNDICYTLTSESNTDKCLDDRRNEFISNNLSICEEDCEFNNYNDTEKRAICSCITKTELPPISETKTDKNKLISNFIEINNIANIKMLKCIYLLFDSKNIFINYANYLLVILLLNGILSTIIFCFYNNKKLKKDIKQIWFETLMKKKYAQNDDKIENKISSKKLKKTKKNRKGKIKSSKNEPPRLKMKMKTNRLSIESNKFRNILETNNIYSKDSTSKRVHGSDKNVFSNIDLNNNQTHRKSSQRNMERLPKNKTLDVKKLKENIKSYRDIELNNMIYIEALKYDHRSYIKYYISLLKSRNLLIFTFCECKDYNSQIIKIYSFFMSFAINYAVSAMFYSDETMHKIYVDSGFFDIKYQLPQMIYSSLISFVLTFILDFFGFYEDNLLDMKKIIKTINVSSKIIKEVHNCILIKIILFFIFSYILSICFWIYIGCFCAVYKNTQIHLLKEVLFSFLVSFLSPFFYYLIPGILRIPSLKINSKKRAVIYKISQFLQMF